MPGGFESGNPPVAGVYRLLEQSATARPSPVLTVGLVDIERGRGLTMALVLGPAGRLRRRPRTRVGLLVWMHDRDKCWLVAGGGQGRLLGTPELEATANPLWHCDVTGSIHDLDELSFTSADAQRFVHLAPGDAEDAALLRRPFPRIITAREVVPVEPIVTDTTEVPTWAQARAYLAAAIGAG